MNTILVFKTNIRTQDDLLAVSDKLNNHHHIHDWSVDQEDVDCVLRIVSSRINANEIVFMMNQTGYDCQELE